MRDVQMCCELALSKQYYRVWAGRDRGQIFLDSIVKPYLFSAHVTSSAPGKQ